MPQRINFEDSEPSLLSYLNLTRQAAEAALTNLNSSINWALTLIIGVIAFVAQSISGSPSDNILALALLILAVSLLMLVHFGVRTAKSYLNLLRFSLLEAATLRHLLDGNNKAAPIRNSIKLYHLQWHRPITNGRIISKILFEFGFFYLFIIITCLYGYIVNLLWLKESNAVIVVLITFSVPIFISIELLIFANSPYIQNRNLDSETMLKS